MTRTCYERAATVVAAGENLAVSHGFVARDVRWGEQHWDWSARRLMEAAYHRACAEREGHAMLPEWQACEARMRAAYERGAS